jgi:tight adherence protein B
VIAIASASLAALGVYLVYTAVVFGRRTVCPSARKDRPARDGRIDRWLREAGVPGLGRRQVVALLAGLFVVVTAITYAIVGAVAPSLTAGGFAAALPVASSRRRAAARDSAARDAWPRMIEEIRVLTGSLGRSVPQALFEVGRRAPTELQPAFRSAQREWQLSTDFARSVGILKTLLADPAADATLETLLVAHDLGGQSLGRRLEVLAADRLADVQSRKDARSRQAGVRFARRFVIIVPAGMALVGLQIGDGRAAYATAGGQVAALVAVACVVACWWWSSLLLRLPGERRVFDR